jgi:O-antigen polymerase
VHFLTDLGPALALAVPFLFSSTRAPLTNFWPLMCAWLCAGVLALLLVWQARRPDAPGRHALARQCAAGVLLAALLGSAVGLLQYFGQTDGWWGWLHPTQPGLAMGQLRQRNQQASLLSLGLWTLWWLVAQVPRNGPDGARGHSVLAVGLGLLLAWALALLAWAVRPRPRARGWRSGWCCVFCWRWWRAWVGRVPLGFGAGGLGFTVGRRGCCRSCCGNGPAFVPKACSAALGRRRAAPAAGCCGPTCGT